MELLVILRQKRFQKATVRSVTAITGNISAAYYGVILISPSFFPFSSFRNVLALLNALFFGTLFLAITIYLESKKL